MSFSMQGILRLYLRYDNYNATIVNGKLEIQFRMKIAINYPHVVPELN